MAFTKPCPTCGHENDRKATECAKCSVIFADVKPRAEDGPRVQHKSNPNERACSHPGCDAPATIFPGVMQGGGSGWCSAHYRNRSSAPAGSRSPEQVRSLLDDLKSLLTGPRVVSYRKVDEFKKLGKDAPLYTIEVKE